MQGFITIGLRAEVPLSFPDFTLTYTAQRSTNRFLKYIENLFFYSMPY